VWCGVVTVFPGMFRAVSEFGMTRRAIQKGLLEISCWNPRDFAVDKHKTVDARPYGGGPGMVMGVYPLRTAIHAAQASRSESSHPVKKIYLSPQGKPLNQGAIQQLALNPNLLLVTGRYEGVDERLIEMEIDEEWSIGDYVLTGGELAAMVMIDALVRLIPGVMGHPASVACDSFSEGLLDYPHYTRPEVVCERSVPDVLLGGNHRAIARWRLKQRLGRTWLRRPDLLKRFDFNEESRTLLQEFSDEHKIQGDF